MPAFVQAPESPFGEDEQLVLQIDSEDVPFAINFGMAVLAMFSSRPMPAPAGSSGSVCSLCSPPSMLELRV